MYGIPDRLKALSAAEEQVLLALWDCKPPVSRRDIGARLAEKGWAAATVLNFLYRLEEKGWVTCTKEQNHNLYAPTVTRRAYGVYTMRQRLDTVFGGDLAQAVRALGGFDLILCGRQAIDGDTAQVGPQIAEKLKLPQICYVEEVVELGKGKVVARRAIDGGYEVLESPLPALMTVIDSNEPRPMNAKLIMKYKRARTPSEVAREFTNSNYTEGNELDARLRSLETKGLLIKEYSATDINADPARIGFPGSPTKVKQVMSVVLTASEAKSVPATAEGINELIHELISDHTLG